jgi:hypothetical protein
MSNSFCFSEQLYHATLSCDIPEQFLYLQLKFRSTLFYKNTLNIKAKIKEEK